MVIFLLSLTEITFRIPGVGTLSFSELAALAIVFYLCFAYRKLVLGRFQLVVWAMVVWLLVAGLILNFQEDFSFASHLSNWLRVLILAAFVSVFPIMIGTSQKLKSAYRYLYLVVIIHCLLMVVDGTLGLPISWHDTTQFFSFGEEGERPAGLMAEPSFFSSFCLISYLTLLNAKQKGMIFRKWPLFLSLLIFSLVISKSLAGAFVGLYIIGCEMVGALGHRKKNKHQANFFVGFGSLLLAITVVVALSFSGTTDYVSERMANVWADGSTRVRVLNSYTMTEKVSEDYFWTGVGMGGTNHELINDQTRNRLDLMTAEERACTIEERCIVDLKASSFTFFTSLYANGGIVALTLLLWLIYVSVSGSRVPVILGLIFWAVTRGQFFIPFGILCLLLLAMTRDNELKSR